MPAALAAWKEKADEWAASASEDIGGLEGEVAKPGPLVSRLMEDATKFGDYETLYQADSIPLKKRAGWALLGLQVVLRRSFTTQICVIYRPI